MKQKQHFEIVDARFLVYIQFNLKICGDRGKFCSPEFRKENESGDPHFVLLFLKVYINFYEIKTKL